MSFVLCEGILQDIKVGSKGDRRVVKVKDVTFSVEFGSEKGPTNKPKLSEVRGRRVEVIVK